MQKIFVLWVLIASATTFGGHDRKPGWHVWGVYPTARECFAQTAAPEFIAKFRGKNYATTCQPRKNWGYLAGTIKLITHEGPLHEPWWNLWVRYHYSWRLRGIEMPPGWFAHAAHETEDSCREMMRHAPFMQEDLMCLPATTMPEQRKLDFLRDYHGNPNS